MNKETKERFIKRLETTNHNQIRGSLRTSRGFCVWGEFIDEFEPDSWEQGEEDRDGVTQYLCRRLNSALPTFVNNKYYISSCFEQKLMDWNDTDKLTFKEIAQKLREET